MKTPWGFHGNPMKYGTHQHTRPGAAERPGVNNSFGQWCSTHVPLQKYDVLLNPSCSRGRTQLWHWLTRLISSLPRRVEANRECVVSVRPAFGEDEAPQVGEREGVPGAGPECRSLAE